jgi:4-methyl-5(b-hydroxyethyl)-thiazole monophosphate biosynthesis
MKVLIPVAEGVEEMELTILVDVCRRAGWKVVAASIADDIVEASRGVRVQTDSKWDDIVPADYDLLLIPGGKGGVDRLSVHEGVLCAIRDFDEAGKWIGAVCAGPLALQVAGVLEGRRVTCYPGLAAELTATQRLEGRGIVDDKLITSQGPGTCFEFVLRIIELVEGRDIAQSIGRALCL